MRHFSGQRLRAARTAAGVPIERVALTVGRSVWTVHDYERGQYAPPGDIVGALADALGIEIDELFADPAAVSA